jgi:hypothetical protein
VRIREINRNYLILRCALSDVALILLVINVLIKFEGSKFVPLIDLTQDRDRCKVLVNTIMNLRVP